jgi:hypothetical protein
MHSAKSDYFRINGWVVFTGLKAMNLKSDNLGLNKDLFL